MGTANNDEQQNSWVGQYILYSSHVKQVKGIRNIFVSLTCKQKYWHVMNQANSLNSVYRLLAQGPPQIWDMSAMHLTVHVAVPRLVASFKSFPP